MNTKQPENFLGIIPARFASTRFPGKPLADLGGKPMIQWVYEGASKALAKLIVATDHEDIKTAVEAFGGNAMMTSADHQSGTDRCAEVVQSLLEAGENYDVAVNIQGDEPFLQIEHLEMLKVAFEDPEIQIATLATPIMGEKELVNPNAVKLVQDLRGRAIYFSRHPIPYLRKQPPANPLHEFTYLKHLGVYAYRSETLLEITRFPRSPLEKAESLEQLRWLENGYRIKVQLTTQPSLGVDTPEDLEAARAYLKRN